MKDNAASDILKSWHGVAFEQLCWQHVAQMKRALEIGGVKTSLSAWCMNGNEEHKGVQIDMLIFRNDNVVNLCEMKFVSSPYEIDKEENMRLRERIDALKATLSPKQVVYLTLVTTFGVAHGKYSGIVQNQITLDDLFT